MRVRLCFSQMKDRVSHASLHRTKAMCGVLAWTRELITMVFSGSLPEMSFISSDGLTQAVMPHVFCRSGLDIGPSCERRMRAPARATSWHKTTPRNGPSNSQGGGQKIAVIALARCGRPFRTHRTSGHGSSVACGFPLTCDTNPGHGAPGFASGPEIFAIDTITGGIGGSCSTRRARKLRPWMTRGRRALPLHLERADRPRLYIRGGGEQR